MNAFQTRLNEVYNALVNECGVDEEDLGDKCLNSILGDALKITFEDFKNPTFLKKELPRYERHDVHV